MRKRKDEKFKRIKGSTLAKLLSQQTYSSESIYALAEGEEMKMPDTADGAESMHTVNTMMTGASAVTYNTEQLGITQETTFLLLDMREESEYDDYHIKESLNFPAPNVTRDKIIPELFRFRNKEDKLIIVYMYDERSGVAAAKLLYEKGYDNVFLLSGGIEEFLQENGDFVEGKNVPDIVAQKKEADEYNATMLSLQEKKNRASRV